MIIKLQLKRDTIGLQVQGDKFALYNQAIVYLPL